MASDFKISKRVSVQDICEDVVLHSKGAGANTSYKSKVYNSINKTINHYGFCASDVYIALNEMDGVTLKKLDMLHTSPPDLNLLCGISRTHRETHIISAAPVISFDDDVLLDFLEDDVKYQHYLEERASLSLDELVDYFLKFTSVVRDPDTKNIRATLSRELKAVGDVNIMLFMIDDLMRDYKSKGQYLYNYIAIRNYKEYGYAKHKEMLDRMATGNFKFIPRIRS